MYSHTYNVALMLAKSSSNTILCPDKLSLGVDTVCDNKDVTLMCRTDQITDNMITWYWSNQSQHGDTITVVARMSGVLYTCVAYDQGQEVVK